MKHVDDSLQGKIEVGAWDAEVSLQILLAGRGSGQFLQ